MIRNGVPWCRYCGYGDRCPAKDVGDRYREKYGDDPLERIFFALMEDPSAGVAELATYENRLD